MGDPIYYTGSDDRDLSGGGGLRSLRSEFWRSFEFAQRNGCTDEFIGIYRGLPTFAAEVREADRVISERTKGAA